MSKEKTTCSKCGSPTVCQEAGRLTQWIFVCTCAASVPSGSAPVLSVTISICSRCGKRLSVNDGSLTQWIFGHERCSCERPEPIGKTVSTYAEDVHDRDGPEDPEMQVEGGDFPLSRYKPIAELGKGASSTVYLCHDKMLDKKVAVKILHSLTADQLVSFQNEAKSTSALKHPNIIVVLDFGASESGAPYMVMEYFQGVSLERYFNEYPALQEGVLRQIFGRLADALHYAHLHNVFHRDIKPANILIRDGSDGIDVRLIDFGVATVKENTGFVTEFQSKTLVGTPAYMSPDAVSGQEYDARSEVYALGCVLFEAVAGRPPFEGETALQVLAKHVDQQAPSAKDLVGNEVSDDLNEIISKCLSKKKSDRYDSMKDLQRSLLQQGVKSIPVSEPQAVSGLPDGRGTIAGVVVGVAALVALIALGTFVSRMTPGTEVGVIEKPSEPIDLKIEGTFFERDHEDSSAYFYEHAAEQGDVDAQVKLGEMYYNKKDYQNAYDWFRKAADAGNARAQYWLSICYQWGQGVKQDRKKAFDWAKKGARQGDVKAEYRLAEYYYSGNGVKRDRKKAFELVQIPAAKDYGLAVHRLGHCYSVGSGTTQDLEKAVKCFEHAAQLGLAKSQYCLGDLYLNGKGGVKEDAARGCALLRQAAEKNHGEAQHALGECYLKGVGVKKDRSEGLRWLELSAGNGNPKAKARLAELKLSHHGDAKFPSLDGSN